MIAVLSLASASVCFAADAVKKKPETPSYNDPSIGVFGAHRTPGGGTPASRNAVPPPPSAAPAQPKVEAESPIISGPGTSPAPLSAAPRPDAQVEGAPTGQAGPLRAQPQQVNSFLAGHPFISGLIAGLIGTDLGSIVYGGTMMGDENAALIGFIGRIVLVILVAVTAVRLVWRLVGGSRNEALVVPQGPRREPSFARSSHEIDEGRRESSLRADRPSYGERPGRRR